MSRYQLQLRAGFLIALGCAAIALRLLDPALLSSLPLRTSCGAVTGLPCIFCGMTRALHHLLNGEFAMAAYMNWLVFPLVSLTLAFSMRTGAEVVLRRRLPLELPAVRLTPGSAAVAALLLLGLWVLQVSLAVSQGKRELLNPDGLLYALLTR